VREVLFIQDIMEIQEITETVDIVDDMEGATISGVLTKIGGK